MFWPSQYVIKKLSDICKWIFFNQNVLEGAHTIWALEVHVHCGAAHNATRQPSSRGHLEGASLKVIRRLSIKEAVGAAALCLEALRTEANPTCVRGPVVAATAATQTGCSWEGGWSESPAPMPWQWRKRTPSAMSRATALPWPATGRPSGARFLTPAHGRQPTSIVPGTPAPLPTRVTDPDWGTVTLRAWACMPRTRQWTHHAFPYTPATRQPPHPRTSAAVLTASCASSRSIP